MKYTILAVALVLIFVSVQGACTSTSEGPNQDTAHDSKAMQSRSSTDAARPDVAGQRQAYFGDLHIHTQNSFDAYNFGVRATPDDAYRWARGEAIEHPLGYTIRLKGGALDFLAVSDHAEYLGAPKALADPAHPLGSHPLGKEIQSGELTRTMQAFNTLSEVITGGEPVPGLDASSVVRSTWQETIAAAERYNMPGQFTALIGYEYTSTPGGANLHRNVIFKGSKVPDVPFGADQSLNPEDLWKWLDEQRATGIEALAIPHNSNWSQGKMFERTNWAGEPIDAAYAELRIRNEPLVEITQVKGTSETHPLLSPNDEWADFELWKSSKLAPGEDGRITVSEGSTTGAYARDALRAGLEIEEKIGANPYTFGFIGSSDGHDAAGPVEEDQNFGKLGLADGAPDLRGSVPAKPGQAPPLFPFSMVLEWSASGLAGVWAEENTRTAIYSAFRRKETFATSGPRISIRLFAGYGYSEDLPHQRDAFERAYAGGVAMGGEWVARKREAPGFFVWAARDANEAWLQRLQIVKGWIDTAGETHERVYDVACSDGLEPDPETHRCPDNGATVDLSDCSVSIDRGSVELSSVWKDPEFDPSHRAFYYARALQNPTCRWSTWDALRVGVAPAPDAPATIQERAWTSPIFMTPNKG